LLQAEDKSEQRGKQQAVSDSLKQCNKKLINGRRGLEETSVQVSNVTQQNQLSDNYSLSQLQWPHGLTSSRNQMEF
jgi:hypothetical protein